MNTPRRLLRAIGASVLLAGLAACAPSTSAPPGPAPVGSAAPLAHADGYGERADGYGERSAPSASGAPAFDLSRHSATDPASPWVVVNKRHPLPPGYVPELTTVRGYLVQPAAAPDLDAMLRAAHDDGVDLTLRSAYRSEAKQRTVYDGWVATLGKAAADGVSARPRFSEHQTGLAVDVGSSTRPDCDFTDCFAATDEGRWVARHAGEYGFMVRYTAENQAVTGFAPEAWHLRWVGRDLAGHLAATGVDSLEDAFDVEGGDYADAS